MNPQPKPTKYRNSDLLAFTREQRCVVCGHYAPGEIEAHHESVTHSKGTGTKIHDSEVLPLCITRLGGTGMIEGCHSKAKSKAWLRLHINPEVEIIKNLTRWLQHRKDNHGLS